MSKRVGDKVRVRGTEYRITDIHSYAGNGSKGFGKHRITVQDAEGRTFTAYGRTITGNSRLTEVSA